MKSRRRMFLAVIAIAVVFVVGGYCYESHVQAVYEPLRDELERGLLTEYATEFEALRDLGG